MFAVLKGDNSANPHAVDAISGATITSQALGRSINLWAKYYEPYLKTLSTVSQEVPAAAEEVSGQTQTAE